MQHNKEICAVRVCYFCGRRFGLSRREARSVNNDFSIFCSPECLIHYSTSKVPNIQILKAFVPLPSCLTKTNGGMRSMSEVYAKKFLSHYKIKYLYEKEAIRLNDGDRYVPDFYLPDFGVLWEVKGKWWLGDKKKMKKVLQVIPESHMVIVPDYMIQKINAFLRGLSI
jgi:hypothetical protein